MSERLTMRAIDARKYAMVLGGIVVFLLFAHLATNVLDKFIENTLTVSLARLFHLDVEANVPTVFAAVLWLLNSILLFTLWRVRRVNHIRQWAWLFLAVLFIYFSLDELFFFHEQWMPHIRRAFDASGFLWFAWVIPYGIGIMVIALFTFSTIWGLEHKVRFWYVAAAVTFVSGAIGLEMIQGKYLEMVGMQKDITSFLLMTVEECLEMAGLVMLVYACLRLQDQTGPDLSEAEPSGQGA